MTESNPFQTPESDVAPDKFKSQSGNTTISCQTVPALNGATWVFDGFRNFFASPFTWLLVIFLYLAMLGVLSMLPFVSIISYIIAPIFMAGLMICARENKHNHAFFVKNLFDGFSLNGGKLAGLGALYLGMLILLMIIIFIIGFALFFGSIENIETMFDPASFNPENIILILLIVLIAFGLMLPIIMAFWFAPALVIFHDIDIFTAIKLSFMGCLKNMLPYLIYSLLFLVIYLIAAIPIFIMIGFFSDPELSIPVITLMVLIGIVELLVFTAVFLTSVYESYEDIFSVDA